MGKRGPGGFDSTTLFQLADRAGGVLTEEIWQSCGSPTSLKNVRRVYKLHQEVQAEAELAANIAAQTPGKQPAAGATSGAGSSRKHKEAGAEPSSSRRTGASGTWSCELCSTWARALQARATRSRCEQRAVRPLALRVLPACGGARAMRLRAGVVAAAAVCVARGPAQCLLVGALQTCSAEGCGCGWGDCPWTLRYSEPVRRLNGHGLCLWWRGGTGRGASGCAQRSPYEPSNLQKLAAARLDV